MIINLGLFVILELASGFCNNLPEFLAVRGLYGIAMGGKRTPSLQHTTFEILTCVQDFLDLLRLQRLRTCPTKLVVFCPACSNKATRPDIS